VLALKFEKLEVHNFATVKWKCSNFMMCWKRITKKTTNIEFFLFSHHIWTCWCQQKCQKPIQPNVGISQYFFFFVLCCFQKIINRKFIVNIILLNPFLVSNKHKTCFSNIICIKMFMGIESVMFRKDSVFLFVLL
jgi:hypothetical protein